ncbi:MAG: glucan 1,4-alpha-glucosidase [Prolixibacteraceae bacterium]|jgi:glucoamylase|nr:glucan 1,4-alpha-glucosidase [Prolixibacteraceae bacterium]
MKRKVIQIALLLVFFTSCVGKFETKKVPAPGAPGKSSVWAYAGKTGIGTSYNSYSNETETISKVWFSVAQGILTETMFGLIHESQIKEMQFIVVGKDFVDYEKSDTKSTIEYLHADEQGRPLSLAYKIITTDIEGKYEIEKHIFTNPDEQSLFVRTIFRANENGITPYLYLNPHVENTGSGDVASVDRKTMHAFQNNTHLTLLSSKKFEVVSTGFVGVSDGISELKKHGKLINLYNTTGDIPGNVAAIAQLKEMNKKGVEYNFSIGFGHSLKESRKAASNTLASGYNKVLKHYNGEGENLGWEDYISSLSELPKMYGSTTDNGKLLNISAMVLKAQEDKSNPGALIASLSNPWGETASAEKPSTGYKAVWPRDFYQCAMALLAMGDIETPLVAFEYLQKVQVQKETPGNKGVTGWFLQKTHVDGEIEWISIQLDQTAMPIMLGWRLWKAGILSNEKAIYWYNQMLKSAATFLVDGGEVDIDWNKIIIVPPKTQQERWEEQPGYSPSTTAAVISGLVCAADFAMLSGDEANAEKFLNAADKFEKQLEETMYTTKGEVGDGNYFVRITSNNNPNDGEKIIANNGKKAMNETLILDAGFLELVRYGVRKANSESILESVEELDMPREENLQVKYLFKFEGDDNSYPGWRRYGNDGYGESVLDGSNYGTQDDTHRGRVWPFFTGERGHYELAKAAESNELDIDKLKNTYVKALEYFANEGGMLPEQVWDGVGVNAANYKTGETTNSATPLAWTHAEYIKLVRSISDQKVWDRYSIVEQRYSK